jgi:hypothetical protein
MARLNVSMNVGVLRSMDPRDGARILEADKKIERAGLRGCSLCEAHWLLEVLFPGIGWAVDRLDRAVQVSRRGGFVVLSVEEVLP